jgi:hypothetical protein
VRVLTIGLFLLATFQLQSSSIAQRPELTSQEGSYIVQQLDSFANRFWARVAGRDTGLPPHINGHDEFAARWTREMLHNLRGLPVGVFRQSFATPGFRQLPAKRPGVNVVVVVPGSYHPDRAIIVGAHYDGEPFSKGSAYDDTSGCAIMLGLARVLGAFWRTHGLPSLTVEFVLFDAEEEGLVGSNAFGFAFRHGAAMPRPVLMINEEQSGVGYPVRPFGLFSQASLPTFATTTTRLRASWSRWFGRLIPPNHAALALLIRRLQAARSAVFTELHAIYDSLSFRSGEAPVFTSSDEPLLKIGPIPICCSDNAPFEALGLPTVTFAGDYHYYEPHAPSWSYPFDQSQDTPQALACDTGGSPKPSTALEAALALPLALSLIVINDYAPPAAGSHTVVFSTVAGAGKPVTFEAFGAQQVRWQFGDGAHAFGTSVMHTYVHPGTYSLEITSSYGTDSWEVVVHNHLPIFKSPFTAAPPPLRPWHPVELENIAGCP